MMMINKTENNKQFANKNNNNNLNNCNNNNKETA